MQTLKERLQTHNDLFSEVVENYDKMLQLGQIDEDDYEQLVLNARIELQQRIDGELGIEADEDEELEYSNGDEVAEFSVGSMYGQALLELGEAAGYDDVEEWCFDLAEATGYNPNDIFGVITGELEPTDELSLDISDVLGLDEDTQATLLVHGIEARGEDINDYLDDEDELEETNEENDDVEYSRVSQLENEIAEFKAVGIIKDELSNIEQKAWSLVEEGRVPPVVIEKLLGNFNTENDRIAAFSAVCNKNQIDSATELYAMNKVLKVLETLPVTANFGYEALQEVTPEEIEQEKSLDEIASNYLKHYNATRTK